MVLKARYNYGNVMWWACVDSNGSVMALFLNEDHTDIFISTMNLGIEKSKQQKEYVDYTEAVPGGNLKGGTTETTSE